MRVGIDASNLRAGGGVTHLVEVLRAAEPARHCFETVTVWGGRSTLAALPSAPWLRLRHEPDLERGLISRLSWQRWSLKRRLTEAESDVLFAPGGSYGGRFRPYVTMSRNLLPFEPAERRRYGLTSMRLKLVLLRRAQATTLHRAAGVIFLNDYARSCVEAVTGTLPGLVRVIPHGIAEEFRARPRPARLLRDASTATPLRLLYVSTVEPYKHQWHVVDAVGQLRSAGLPVALELAGGGREPWRRRLRETIARTDPAGTFVHYSGAVEHSDLPERYRRADVFIFASSCENMPNILLEAMASGLAIACARYPPMTDMLGDAGVYFDPERPADIASALKALLESATARMGAAQAAFDRAAAYSWTRCADETFALLRAVHEAAGAG